ncbi:hypothetical protein PG1C_02410 [Rugosibacter aromaticivorans]|uniref:Uncharacterized protein n=1 Tax=Rugosibacter aromaticivorans TaxID=1565605 RepID=A0A0C5J7N5_9PROT|nr:hypothetical protein [Rugosibacter aromaticivorans]AJP47629.1 hypothetical protein PG1C_02410 [Rugosibacter aromaticivorans]TBR16087.1 MAG: hypothetical protein EPO43_01755 [Rugosibacter sp.]
MSTAIPRPELSALEAHIAAWGLPTTEHRLSKRLSSSMDEVRAFYDAMLPKLPEVIDYLNQFPLDGIPKNDNPLVWATLAMCEVDNAVNKWNRVVLDTGIDIRRMIPKTSFSDRGYE